MISEDCYNCENCLNIPFIQHLLSVYTVPSSILTTSNIKKDNESLTFLEKLTH